MASTPSDPTSPRAMRKVIVPVAIALGILAVAIGTASASHASKPDDGLDRVREATAQFRDVTEAERAQYGRFVDVDGVACIDMPGLGGMGVHYVNQQLVGDGVIDPLTPEAVVYQPDGQGTPRLNAVEYVVVQAQWDATHDDPPSLFGHTFDFTPAPNRFGLPAFYSLHAWAFKANPAGTFSMWNPDVTCHALNH